MSQEVTGGANVVLYLALGAFHAKQAIYSILTILTHYHAKKITFSIIVYTDQSELFACLGKSYPIKAITIPKNLLAEWTGNGRQTLRAKIKCIQSELISGGVNIIYIDSDTLVRKEMEGLFERIRTGNFILHQKEYDLKYARIKHGLYPIDMSVKLEKSNSIIDINENTQMWNSGVVGISSHNKYRMSEVLELNDELYKIIPSWHTEQLSLSIIFSNTGRLIGCKNHVLHYWHHKEVVSPYLEKLSDTSTQRGPRWIDEIKREKITLIWILTIKYYINIMYNQMRADPLAYRLYQILKTLKKQFQSNR